MAKPGTLSAAARRKVEEARETLAVLNARIGATPSERLGWAVRIVQLRLDDLTRGDWDNLCSELAAFVWSPQVLEEVLSPEHVQFTQRVAQMVPTRLGPYPRTNIFKIWLSDPKMADRDLFECLMRPDQDNARDILERMREVIARAVKREPVLLRETRSSETVGLVWFAERSTWVPTSSLGGSMNQADHAALALGDLLREAGALLKECPAPASRSKQGETCGVWFVAKRPNQEYCSAVCQSRASTRAKRSGTETPATIIRRAKQEKEG